MRDYRGWILCVVISLVGCSGALGEGTAGATDSGAPSDMGTAPLDAGFDLGAFADLGLGFDAGPRRGDDTIGSHNSWNVAEVLTDADFLSVSSAGADGPRNADGSLPRLDFLRLSAASALIDRGEDLGRPFTGAAPDIGAFER